MRLLTIASKKDTGPIRTTQLEKGESGGPPPTARKLISRGKKGPLNVRRQKAGFSGRGKEKWEGD